MNADTSVVQRMRVALDANAAAYRRAVQTSVPGDCWDYLILTAANEKQAEGYRQELALRHRGVGPTGAFFPAIQRSIVVPDPPDRRAGSGGATLGAIRELCRQFHLEEANLRQLRILLIHSGGASQRLPAYSPLGKIFAPLPLLRPDGQICTLFDHLYVTLAGLPERLGPGVLILAGDVFLLFDHRHVSAPAGGVTALTMRVDAELGRGHGVYVIDPQQRIRQTLQKAPIETLRQAGALNERGQVLIDTGLLFFDADRTAVLASLGACDSRPAGRATRKAPRPLQDRFPQQIDLYDDMTAALAAATDERQYLADPSTRRLRAELWKALHGIAFQTMQLEGQFLHLGTTRQFRDAMVGNNPAPAAELFQQNVLARGKWGLEDGRRVYHSDLLGAGGSLGPGSVVEQSILGAGCRIGAGCVVSQVLAVKRPIDLPDNLLLFQVPVRGDLKGMRRGATHPALLYVHALCGVHDDFKGRYPACLFLNKPIGEFLKRHRLSPGDIWPSTAPEQRTLWTARLFAGTEDRDEAGCTLWFVSAAKPADGHRWARNWKSLPRFSMAMLLEQADPAALIEHRETVAAYLQTGALLESLQANEDKPLDSFIGHYSSAAAYAASIERIRQFASASAGRPELAVQQARALWCGAQIVQRPDHPSPDARVQIEEHMTRAFAKIAEASEPGVAAGPQVRSPACPSPRLTPGLRIEGTSPVRLDLSGGWSDTPPYCYERGGHVVNVAINLDNHPPVRAMVRTIREPVLILESNDLGTHIELTGAEAVGRGGDVHDPFSLHKVALDLAGLLPRAGGNRGAATLQAHLRKLGAGLIVSTECRVPKGSGLGTSSILAATLLAALDELRSPSTSENRESKIAAVIAQTLLLEQRLSTGGGWQDQVGGIVGGVKSTVTEPGIPQKPIVESLDLADEAYEAMQQRLVVYYSGQQRLARDILRRVMGRWLAREPAVLILLQELKQSAAALRRALLKAQWPAVAREIARYWEIKKQLYPGSTTPTIDVLFLELREHYLAAGLAGAGGGGFAYFFCKDARQAARLRDLLARRGARPGSLGALFQTQINRTGLSVTRKSS